MKKVPSQERRVAKKGHKRLPDDAFDVVLESTGMYECGEPASYMLPIFDSGQAAPVGWWHEIEDLGRYGLACGEGPYWSVLEIVLPKQRLYFAARSFETDDPDTLSSQFYIHEIIWEETKRKMRPRSAFDGPRKAWRPYSCGVVDDTIRKGLKEKPWLFFEFSDGDSPSIAFDTDDIRAFLERVAKPARTKPKDRKLFRRLLEAIFALDPNGLLGAIRALIKEHQKFEETVRLMIPEAFHLAAIDSERLETADELATEFSLSGRSCSRRIILRLARKLKCQPRIGRHGRFSFDPQAARQIFEEHNAERTRTRYAD